MKHQFTLALLIFFSILLMLLFINAGRFAAPPEPSVKITADPLEEAALSVGMLHFNEYGGSFILIGRENLHNGKYQYHALTCHHVVEGPAEDKDDRVATIAYQTGFHNRLTVVEVPVDEFNYLVPEHDWAVISFTLDAKLPIAIIATQQEFEAINRFDTIYGVAGDDLTQIHSRMSSMGSADNIDYFREFEQAMSPRPQNAHAEDYFHPWQDAWRGSSGGGVFDRHGKLIGMYTALTMQAGGGTEWQGFSIVCQKVFEIRKFITKENIIGIKD